MKFGITFFICFLIFIAWRFYEQRKSERMEKKISDDFWKKEEEANQTRKKDITNLPLLQVKKADLPKLSSTDEAVLNYMEHLHQIVKNPMIDLSEYSNTDLKLAYGVANFKTLALRSQWDKGWKNNSLLASPSIRHPTRIISGTIGIFTFSINIPPDFSVCPQLRAVSGRRSILIQPPLKPGSEILENQASFWLSCGHITPGSA